MSELEIYKGMVNKMKDDEIKKILDRLERIDHKEYSGGFEFADSSTFNETARCFEERKKMADYITNLQQENEKLKDIIEHKPFFDFTTDIYDELEDYKSRCEKAVEYIKKETKDMPVNGCRIRLNEILEFLNGRSDE